MPADQEEIHRLSLSENTQDRLKAVVLIGDEFENLPDKSAAWDDLIRLTIDKDWKVRGGAANSLGSAFFSVPDKSVAWADLHKLTSNEDSEVRWNALDAFGFIFSSLPNKSEAWDDLHRLTSDKDSNVRRLAAIALGSAFFSVSDKSAAWADLHRLTSDKNWKVRSSAAYALGSAFSSVPDRSTAWADLHRLISNKNSYVRSSAANAFGSAFSSVPDKSVAWDDLHKLTSDKNSYIRSEAANSLGSAFFSVPDKSAAWDDLHRLTIDKDWNVRGRAAKSIGSAFFSIPDKSVAWNDLHRLTSDEDSEVKMYTNQSLGKICIYKASKSENEDDSRSFLEEAILYFEKAAKEDTWDNPAKFCSVFYRSFDAVLFKKVNSKKEIEKYITDAKEEVWGSESKQKLIEAIEQLAEALEIAHEAPESGSDWQETLKNCSEICNYAEQLMDENKDKTPAVHSLYKIAKPSFDKRITELIDKLKENADIAYDKSRNTPAEPIASFIKEEIYGWNVTDQNLMSMSLDLLCESLRQQIPKIPDNKGILDQINQIKSYTKVEDQMLILSTLISQLPTISFAAKTYEKVIQTNETVTRTENKVDLILQTVTELKNLSDTLKEEGNEIGSQDVNDIADKIKVLFESKDHKEIILFIEKIREKVPSLFEEIEKSTASKDVKEKAKKGLKETIMETGKDIASGVATNWIAAYLTSIVAASAPGFLVPAIILAALISIENMKNQR
jgi:HEAT repeat protein